MNIQNKQPSLFERDLWMEALLSSKVSDVSTVEEFVKRYYKHERLYGRGKEYGDIVIQSHKTDLETYGYDWISWNESITGEIISFFPSQAGVMTGRKRLK